MGRTYYLSGEQHTKGHSRCRQVLIRNETKPLLYSFDGILLWNGFTVDSQGHKGSLSENMRKELVNMLKEGKFSVDGQVICRDIDVLIDFDAWCGAEDTVSGDNLPRGHIAFKPVIQEVEK